MCILICMLNIEVKLLGIHISYINIACQLVYMFLA